MENRRSNIAEKFLRRMAAARMPEFEMPSLRDSSEICIATGDKPLRIRGIDLEVCPETKLQPMKRPSFRFYPQDWMQSTGLRSCSIGARGLWMDMLCLMHEGTPYGHLKVNQKVILASDLACIARASLEETEGWINELIHAGVCSKNTDVILCSRMVLDEAIRSKRAAGGRLGGNPKLRRLNCKTQSKVNLQLNLDPTNAAELKRTDKARPKNEQEVVDFCESIGIPDGSYFWHKWNGNGFQNGGNAIRSWKATIRSWKSAGHLPSQRQNGGRQTTVSHVAKEGEEW